MAISVWPRIGETYPDALNVPITSVGATVAESEYITDALRGGFLLAEDPLEVFEPEDRTDIPGGGSEVARLVVDLDTLAGSEGAIEFCSGHTLAGDGGGGSFYWASGDDQDADGGVVLGSVSGGRWHRIFSGAVNVRWFGAAGEGATNDAPAIQAALDLGKDVFVPSGTYRIDTELVMYDNQSVGGEGVTSVLVANSGTYAVSITDITDARLHDLMVLCNVGNSAVEVKATLSGYVMRPAFERVRIQVATTGTSTGFDLSVADTSGALIIYFPRFIDCHVDSASPGFGLNTGIKMRGAVGTYSRSVGGRVERGRYSWMRYGIDIDNCDTWVVDGPAFDGVYEVGSPSTANAGRCIRLGTYTQLAEVKAPRFEDSDVWIESLGIAPRVHMSTGPGPGLVIPNPFPGDLDINGVGGSGTASRDGQNVMHSRQQYFGATVAHGYHEVTPATAGVTIQQLKGPNTSAPMVRIEGPVGAFALGSIYQYPNVGPDGYPSGSLKYVYNTTAHALTVKNEDAGGIAAERIRTMTGADVIVPGPAVLKFIYDVSFTGGAGSSRWLYMGAG